MKNPLAVALGQLGKGKNKTMTPAARRQRRQAARSRWKAYRAARRAAAKVAG